MHQWRRYFPEFVPDRIHADNALVQLQCGQCHLPRQLMLPLASTVTEQQHVEVDIYLRGGAPPLLTPENIGAVVNTLLPLDRERAMTVCWMYGQDHPLYCSNCSAPHCLRCATYLETDGEHVHSKGEEATVVCCPHCQTMIEVTEGCEYLTCRCRHTFEWVSQRRPSVVVEELETITIDWFRRPSQGSFQRIPATTTPTCWWSWWYESVPVGSLEEVEEWLQHPPLTPWERFVQSHPLPADILQYGIEQQWMPQVTLGQQLWARARYLARPPPPSVSEVDVLRKIQEEVIAWVTWCGCMGPLYEPQHNLIEMHLHCIVAYEESTRAIGRRGALLHSVPEDLKRFRELTTGKVVVMGMGTWRSMGSKPLRNRINVVLSRSEPRSIEGEGEEVVHMGVCSLEEAIALGRMYRKDVFVIGGQSVYEEVLNHPKLETIYATEFLQPSTEEGDRFFPKFYEARYEALTVAETEEYRFVNFHRRFLVPPPPLRHADHEYCMLVKQVLDEGVYRKDRTGVHTLSLFGCQARFDLRQSFPLLTTKQVFFRGVKEELFWFLSGDTRVSTLASKKVHIWDANGSRAFLDGCGLTDRAEGDLGPVYGFQWRHFGAEYTTAEADYTGKGVDQVKEVIRQIREEPHSRRILLSAWNPAALADMALPPCHVFCQFWVEGEELKCHMYQRSVDLGLGFPFNIASYALLTRLIAHVTNLTATELVISTGDTHVYTTHVNALKEQIARSVPASPQLRITKTTEDLFALTPEDVELVDYHPQGVIKMGMAL